MRRRFHSRNVATSRPSLAGRATPAIGGILLQNSLMIVENRDSVFATAITGVGAMMGRLSGDRDRLFYGAASQSLSKRPRSSKA